MFAPDYRKCTPSKIKIALLTQDDCLCPVWLLHTSLLWPIIEMMMKRTIHDQAQFIAAWMTFSQRT